MKRTNQNVIPISSAHRHYRRPYPNAAEPQYFLNKLLDGIIAAASCLGCITIFFFVATM